MQRKIVIIIISEGSVSHINNVRPAWFPGVIASWSLNKYVRYEAHAFLRMCRKLACKLSHSEKQTF